MPLGFNVSHGCSLTGLAAGGVLPRWIALCPRRDAQHSNLLLVLRLRRFKSGVLTARLCSQSFNSGGNLEIHRKEFVWAYTLYDDI
jgi:hypothetical protein